MICAKALEYIKSDNVEVIPIEKGRILESNKEAGDGVDIFTPNDKINLTEFQSHLARYAFAAGFVNGKLVLDVACIWGYGSRFLYDKGAKAVVGGDISTEAIKCAHKFWRRQGTEFVLLDATKLPFADNSFEAIVSLETIEHLSQYEDFLSECKRVLKEGGEFICSTPNKGFGISGILKTYPSHIHEFHLEEFQGLLSRFFIEVRLYGQDYWRKGEGQLWKIKFKIGSAIRQPFPKLYEIMEFFYKRFIRRDRYVQLSQIVDWDKILTEKYEPFPLVGSSPIPKQIIAVARK